MPELRLISTPDAADRLGVSASYLNKLRVTGGGPPFVKIGARVAYDPADLAVWLEGQKRQSTASAGGPGGPRFPNEEIRAAVVNERDEGFVVSYLDPSSWGRRVADCHAVVGHSQASVPLAEAAIRQP